MKLLGAALLVGAAFTACSEPERAPLLQTGHRGGSSSHGDGGPGGAEVGGGGGAGTTTAVQNFDPGEIYLVGMLNRPAAGFAVSPLSRPNEYVLGFPSYILAWEVQMLDGQLYYISTLGTRRFVPEFWSNAAPEVLPSYPDVPAKNDPLFPTPPCDGTVARQSLEGPIMEGGALRILSSPDGEMIYECPDGWREGGAAFDLGAQTVALGHGRIALVRTSNSTPGYSLVNRDDGTTVVVSGIKQILAARSTGDGFMVANGDPDGLALHAVHLDGTVELLGTYPIHGSDADDFGLEPNRYAGVLAPDGAFYQLMNAEKSVLRRTVDGTAEVVVVTGALGVALSIRQGFTWLVTGR